MCINPSLTHYQGLRRKAVHCQKEEAGGEDFIGKSYTHVDFSLIPQLCTTDEREMLFPYLEPNEEGFQNTTQRAWLGLVSEFGECSDIST